MCSAVPCNAVCSAVSCNIVYIAVQCIVQCNAMQCSLPVLVLASRQHVHGLLQGGREVSVRGKAAALVQCRHHRLHLSLQHVKHMFYAFFSSSPPPPPPFVCVCVCCCCCCFCCWWFVCFLLLLLRPKFIN